ncbi:hypothetical protein ACIPT2_09425 [Pectobacterium brasiliense]|uniref:hypothetical protein n=1 Tax=Pectobacterium brasiliense TaxID=180957 RepID=UPI00381D08AE
MTEKAVVFSSIHEIQHRASFRDNQEISPENFQSLVGRYRFDEEVICQVKTAKGFCHQKHKVGWVGKTNDGTEVLIGGHCAGIYFRADRRFVMETKRINKEIEHEKLKNKITEYRSNVLVLNQKLKVMRDELIEVRKKMSTFYKSVPNVILKFVYEAQKNQNWDVIVDVLDRSVHRHQDEWIIHKLSTLKPISPIENALGTIGRLKFVSEKYEELCKIDLNTLSTPKMKQYVDALSRIDEVEKESFRLKREAKFFFESRNLDFFLYICDDYEEKFLTVRSILAVTDAKVSSDAHINLRINRIVERVEKSLGGSQVRKNQISLKYRHSQR